MKTLTMRMMTSLLLAGAALAPGVARAQVAVVDVAAVKQESTSALQSVAAVQKQIAQYNLQVQQYQNAVQNTLAPATNIYRQATQDVSSAQTSMDGVTKIIPTNTSMSAYLGQFTNGTGVTPSTNLCSTQGLCSQSQLAAAQSAATAASQARDAALVQGGQTQLQALRSQSTDLQSITTASKGATGQMQSMGYGNQINAVNANASLQIASILTQQQQKQAADELAAQLSVARQSQLSAAEGQAAVAAEQARMNATVAPAADYQDMTKGLPQNP